MKPIVQTPHQVLITPAKQVFAVDKKIKLIIADMKKTLIKADHPKGVGLAAPQIGVSLKIFLMRPEEKDPIKTFINPEITQKSKEMVKGIPGDDNRIEGCLSIPNVWGVVKRHESIHIKYLDENGLEQEKTLTDFPATIAQHEVDHLNGILFTRRVIEQKGELYKIVYDENGKEILEPLKL